ncbi:MAG: 3-isopropylmalate dehydratase [Verrucomicrobiota bacterium]|nr:3-isopropylmalate dehydratase [Verrucomicrobiota bacterium]
MSQIIKGKVFVVGDNIDTDQIIPAQYLTLVPTIKEEYKKLGSYAFAGLPDSYKKFIKDGEMETEYPIIIAGNNFGCGSSREHAPISLGAAGTQVVIAQSFARIFFRNSIATGEIYPIDIETRLVDDLKTGDMVSVDIDKCILKTEEKEYTLGDLGDAKTVIENGGLFGHARKTGMI